MEIPTLQQLSFTVRPGELLAVIGPVGAGKVSHNVLACFTLFLLQFCWTYAFKFYEFLMLCCIIHLGAHTGIQSSWGNATYCEEYGLRFKIKTSTLPQCFTFSINVTVTSTCIPVWVNGSHVLLHSVLVLEFF